jgi:hypothetical protein
VAAADGADTKTKSADSNRRLLLGGLSLLIVVLLAGFWLSGRSRPSALPPPLAEIGVVDLQTVMRAHNAYGELVKLRAERAALAADLDMDRRLLLELTAPKVADQPFKDAVTQKRDQAVHVQRDAQLAQLREAEQRQRQATQPAYAAARDDINGAYLNAIFNIRLKLDNAKSMRLSPESIQDLQKQLVALQQERGEKQQELEARYEASIAAYTAAIAEKNGIELQNTAATTEQLQAVELKKQSDAQRRNAEAVQNNMLDAAARRQRMAKKQAELTAKDQEIAVMEEQMLKEIAGKAAKLAVLHHLTLILANPSVNLAAIPTGMLHVGAWPEKYAPLVKNDALDLTAELVQELK